MEHAQKRYQQDQDILAVYAVDMTALARERRLDPVIGREEEIRRTIHVLARRIKNNPVLIGPPGVGKTAIVEGLAQRIVLGDVPERLRMKRLLSLDIAQIVAGAKYRGEFEERLKAILKAITAEAGNILLFIDEIHSLAHVGEGEGSVGAANMLKPALARGDLHCIGATTLDEYRMSMEKDAALARRFQPVYVGEPSVEDTISILRGLKEKYELHHGVHIQDSALTAAAQWAKRYISERYLPDKAIDLIDEASASMRMVMDSKPETLDALDRSITTWKIEQAALRKEDDERAKKRLKDLEKELEKAEKQSETLTQAWQKEKNALTHLRGLKERLEKTKMILEKVERDGDYERAGELRHAVIPQLKTDIDQLEEERQKRGAIVHERVGEADIAKVLARWTGIPVDAMLQSERQRLLTMEKSLQKRVIGQDEAVHSVSETVRRARAGLQDPTKPLGVFLFLGPSGVGKTELAKALAVFLFADEQALLRIDMSEYMEKHNVARMIGAPPGYVGYEQGGTLTEAVRRRPYQIILLDEVEKAHTDVFNILLQLFDDGRLTDGQGRQVDFRHTLMIMTSNMGSALYANRPSDKILNQEERETLMADVRQYFKPELINRLDEIIFFNALGSDVMAQIVDVRLRDFAHMLSARGIVLEVDSPARLWFARMGHDVSYGARPLNRLIQKELKNPLASLLLTEEGQGRNDDKDSVKAVVKVTRKSGQEGLNLSWLPQRQ